MPGRRTQQDPYRPRTVQVLLLTEPAAGTGVALSGVSRLPVGPAEHGSTPDEYHEGYSVSEDA